MVVHTPWRSVVSRTDVLNNGEAIVAIPQERIVINKCEVIPFSTKEQAMK